MILYKRFCCDEYLHLYASLSASLSNYLGCESCCRFISTRWWHILYSMPRESKIIVFFLNNKSNDSSSIDPSHHWYRSAQHCAWFLISSPSIMEDEYCFGSSYFPQAIDVDHRKRDLNYLKLSIVSNIQPGHEPHAVTISDGYGLNQSKVDSKLHLFSECLAIFFFCRWEMLRGL